MSRRLAFLWGITAALCWGALQSGTDQVTALANEGLQLTQQEKLAEASVYFRKALQIDPSRSIVRFNLALNEYRLGEYALAQLDLEGVLKDRPDYPPAMLLLGTILGRRNDCNGALRLLRATPDLAQRQPDSTIVLARCLYATGRKQEGWETIRSVVKFEAEFVAAGARTLVDIGEATQALDLLATLPSASRNQYQPAWTLALAYYNLQKYAEGQSILESLSIRGSETADSLSLLAWCRQRLESPIAARAAMQKSVDLEPGNAKRHIYLAQLLIEQKEFSLAYVSAMKALQLAPSMAGGQKIKGQAEVGLGLIRQAEKSYDLGVQLDENDAGLLLLLAETQRSLWKYNAAEATLRKGMERFPENPAFPVAYAVMVLDSSTPGSSTKAQGAIDLLGKVLAQNDSVLDAHLALGRYFLSNKKPEIAIKHLERAIDLQPGHKVALLSAMSAYRSLGRNADSRRLLQTLK